MSAKITYVSAGKQDVSLQKAFIYEIICGDIEEVGGWWGGSALLLLAVHCLTLFFILTNKQPLQYMTQDIPDMNMKFTYEYLTYDKAIPNCIPVSGSPPRISFRRS